MRKIVLILSILIFSSLYSVGQNSNQYESQLHIYINYLSNAPNTDTINLENIFLISKKSKLRKEYIKTLKLQINTINRRTQRLQTYINDLEKKLTKTKKIYAQMLIFTYLYKNYFPSNIIFILSSKSFNQAYMRLKFLELSTQYLKSLTKLITLTKNELEYQKRILQQSIYLRKKLISKIKRQQSILEEEFAMLNQIKQNSLQYQQLLNELKKYELVRQSLSKSIETKINIETKDNLSSLTSMFANHKGTLAPPLNNAIVVIPFGIHKHPQLESVKVRNDGIDITSNQDTIVKAVFNGKITNIITLPNGYYAILIKHGEYFTVYSNISKILVKQDATVETGQALGIIQPEKKGKLPILNFQIWHLSEKLNPEDWLNI